MLLTSSGDLAAEEEGWALSPGVGLAAGAAACAATIPGARFARGTLRGRPALVVWTEAAWSVAGAGSAAAGAAPRVGSGAPPAAEARAGAGWAARSAPTRSARRLGLPDGAAGVGSTGWPGPGGV
ncbi:MAG TPA: hypothetical protein VF468_28930, partial [Actinomycetota bacterium]|nr:hypothetical protein [Actinomycetota bacterium]